MTTQEFLERLRRAAQLQQEILKATTSSAQASALIARWSHCDLGPQALEEAASLEARSVVFNWHKETRQ